MSFLDWYKTDATATEKPVVNSHKYDAGPIHAAPLPGSRDSDLDVSTLTSGRHAMKNEYSEYVKLAKQGGHQGMLSSLYLQDAFHSLARSIQHLKRLFL